MSSTAVETAIKIAIAYHRAKGNAHRFRFVGRERGYHGMNIGCVSVGGMINNVKTFASILMPGVQHMRHTHLPEHKFVSGQPETGGDLADDLERIASNFGPENIAACIVEPIAIGSTIHAAIFSGPKLLAILSRSSARSPPVSG